MKQPIFVTGETGLVGSALCQRFRLLSDRYDLLNDRLNPADFDPFDSPWHFFNGTRVIEPEISVLSERNMDRLLLRLPRGTWFMHTAAYTGTDKCDAAAFDAVRSNVLATQFLIELTRRIHGRLVFFSSAVVFDPAAYQTKPFDESTPDRPVTLYGLTKQIAELAIRQSQIQWTILRPVFFYGDAPEDNASALRKVIQATVEQKPIVVLLNRNLIKDYCRIEYGVDLIIEAIERNGSNGQTYVLARGKPKTFEYYLTVMSDVIGVDVMKFVDLVPDADYLGNHVGRSLYPSKGLPADANDDRAGIQKTYDSVVRFLGGL